MEVWSLALGIVELQPCTLLGRRHDQGASGDVPAALACVWADKKGGFGDGVGDDGPKVGAPRRGLNGTTQGVVGLLGRG